MEVDYSDNGFTQQTLDDLLQAITSAITTNTTNINTNINTLAAVNEALASLTESISGLTNSLEDDLAEHISTVNNQVSNLVTLINNINVISVNGQAGEVVLDADDIDDSATTNKFATAAQLTAIANAIAKDGSVEPTQNLPMAGYKHTGVGNATSDTDYISLGQIKSRTVTTRVVTANETYTPATGVNGVRALLIEAVGPGGGGGGIDGQGEATAASSEGGGGGGYVRKFISFADLETSYTIVIGTPGSGGASGDNDGTAGTATTVVGSTPTVNLSAGGGDGGNGSLGTTGAFKNGVRGGAASGGDINVRGGASTGSSVENGNRESVSNSGGSFFGGSEGSKTDGNGFTPTSPGVGGGGCNSVNDGANYAGGDGGPGIVIITEYR
jgi:hypothetical protein